MTLNSELYGCHLMEPWVCGRWLRSSPFYKWENRDWDRGNDCSQVPQLVSGRAWIKNQIQSLCTKFYVTLPHSRWHFIQTLEDMIEMVGSALVLQPPMLLCWTNKTFLPSGSKTSRRWLSDYCQRWLKMKMLRAFVFWWLGRWNSFPCLGNFLHQSFLWGGRAKNVTLAFPACFDGWTWDMATPICSDSSTQDLKQQVETQRSGDCEESMLRAHVRKKKNTPFPGEAGPAVSSVLTATTQVLASRLMAAGLGPHQPSSVARVCLQGHRCS